MEKQNRKHILVAVKHRATETTEKNMKLLAIDIADDLVKNINFSMYHRKFRNQAIRDLNAQYDGELKHLIIEFMMIKIQNNSLLIQRPSIYQAKLITIIKK
jgi:hypothetical protein